MSRTWADVYGSPAASFFPASSTSKSNVTPFASQRASHIRLSPRTPFISISIAEFPFTFDRSRYSKRPMLPPAAKKSYLTNSILLPSLVLNTADHLPGNSGITAKSSNAPPAHLKASCLTDFSRFRRDPVLDSLAALSAELITSNLFCVTETSNVPSSCCFFPLVNAILSSVVISFWIHDCPDGVSSRQRTATYSPYPSGTPVHHK